MKNLTAYNEANEREINSMVGKAMCAYANWQTALKTADENSDRAAKCSMYKHHAELHASEYEATIRCIDFFVKDSIYEIQAYVVDRAETELLSA